MSEERNIIKREQDIEAISEQEYVEQALTQSKVIPRDIGDALSLLFSSEKTADTYVNPVMKDWYTKFPIKLGIKFINGMWKVPWVIKPRSYQQMDKVKAMLANNPQGDLAVAYVMGLEDGANGKLKEQVKGQRTVNEEWLIERGLPVFSKKFIDIKAEVQNRTDKKR